MKKLPILKWRVPQIMIVFCVVMAVLCWAINSDIVGVVFNLTLAVLWGLVYRLSERLQVAQNKLTILYEASIEELREVELKWDKLTDKLVDDIKMRDEEIASLKEKLQRLKDIYHIIDSESYEGD